MNESKSRSWPARGPKAAWARAALAAVAASAALNAGVLALFHSASPGARPVAAPVLAAAPAPGRAPPAREAHPERAQGAAAVAARPASAG